MGLVHDKSPARSFIEQREEMRHDIVNALRATWTPSLMRTLEMTDDSITDYYMTIGRAMYNERCFQIEVRFE